MIFAVWGLWTFTITASPSGKGARCTWAIEAAVSGISEKEEKCASIGAPQFPLDRLLDLLKGERGYFILKALELFYERRRNEVRAEAQYLAELDEGWPQFLESQADPLRDRYCLGLFPCGTESPPQGEDLS